MDPLIAHSLIALAPVIVCLILFERVDAFKLVSPLELVALIGLGAALAAAGFLANGGVLDAFPMPIRDYAALIAPPVEESLKALVIVALFAMNRVGYLIDAVIAGFAVGTGFALAENLFYLHQFAGANVGVWLVRGFGTAIMHGGATAIFAAVSQALFAPRLRVAVDRFHFNPLLFLPGLAAAIAIHATFNYFPDQAVLAMALVLLIVPLALFAIFAKGDASAHQWLAQDREAHLKLLGDLASGAFAQSPQGKALQALADRLKPDGAQDLFDYIRANVALVVRADTTLLDLEEHHHVVLGAPVREQFHRLHALEKKLGHALVLAVRQHLKFSRDDLWKMHELEIDASRKGFGA